MTIRAFILKNRIYPHGALAAYLDLHGLEVPDFKSCSIQRLEVAAYIFPATAIREAAGRLPLYLLQRIATWAPDEALQFASLAIGPENLERCAELRPEAAIRYAWVALSSESRELAVKSAPWTALQYRRASDLAAYSSLLKLPRILETGFPEVHEQISDCTGFAYVEAAAPILASVRPDGELLHDIFSALLPHDNNVRLWLNCHPLVWVTQTPGEGYFDGQEWPGYLSREQAAELDPRPGVQAFRRWFISEGVSVTDFGEG